MGERKSVPRIFTPFVLGEFKAEVNFPFLDKKGATRLSLCGPPCDDKVFFLGRKGKGRRKQDEKRMITSSPEGMLRSREIVYG